MRHRARCDYYDREISVDRVLVIVFLRGGADGLTLVPPLADDVYHRSRPTLAVGEGGAIDLDGYFGLNTSLRPLMSRYEAGDLAIVHGAGSEDTTRSHFEAQDFMEHGGERGGGWLGRYLRARGGVPSALGAVAIGTTLPESLRGAPSGAVIQTIRDFSLGEDRDDAFTDALGRLYARETGAVGRSARETLEAIRRLRALRSEPGEPDGGAEYPETEFGRGLREIARLIKADLGLVASTIDLGNWDTHFGQAALIDNLMDQLARGLDAFVTDLAGEASRVTVVCMTEFGRRLRENSSLGTDHGLASVMFVLGAGVEGGRVHARWRDLGRVDLQGPGDVPVGFNYRDVLAPILRAHSPEINLEAVFPGHAFDEAPLI